MITPNLVLIFCVIITVLVAFFFVLIVSILSKNRQLKILERKTVNAMKRVLSGGSPEDRQQASTYISVREREYSKVYNSRIHSYPDPYEYEFLYRKMPQNLPLPQYLDRTPGGRTHAVIVSLATVFTVLIFGAGAIATNKAMNFVDEDRVYVESQPINCSDATKDDCMKDLASYYHLDYDQSEKDAVLTTLGGSGQVSQEACRAQTGTMYISYADPETPAMTAEKQLGSMGARFSGDGSKFAYFTQDTLDKLPQSDVQKYLDDWLRSKAVANNVYTFQWGQADNAYTTIRGDYLAASNPSQYKSTVEPPVIGATKYTCK